MLFRGNWQEDKKKDIKNTFHIGFSKLINTEDYDKWFQPLNLRNCGKLKLFQKTKVELENPLSLLNSDIPFHDSEVKIKLKFLHNEKHSR